jgi:hypothetical protein
MKIPLVVCMLGMMLSTPAFALKVSVEYAHQVDFSKYTTYRWGKNKAELPDPSSSGAPQPKPPSPSSA